jgi:hypothetical protein
MMGRLYADEDFPFGAVQILRTLGHDVLTVQEAGRGGKPDTEVLADATADGRAVLTHNHRHYQRLHGRGHWTMRIMPPGGKTEASSGGDRSLSSSKSVPCHITLILQLPEKTRASA